MFRASLNQDHVLDRAFMSKAFVKDDGEGEDLALAIDVGVYTPAGMKNYMTKSEFEHLQSEVATLLKDQPIGYERRMRALQGLIDSAEVVDPTAQSGDRVLFGATVTVLDEDEIEHIYKIVGIHEADAKAGKISWISPIGQALLQARVGDGVIVQRPNGDEELEILKIEFKAID
jgi:transcription elongation factor GreB